MMACTAPDLLATGITVFAPTSGLRWPAIARTGEIVGVEFWRPRIGLPCCSDFPRPHAAAPHELATHLHGRTEPMSRNQPLLVGGPQPSLERLAQLLDCGNVRTHRSCSLSAQINRSAMPLPSGARTNAGLDVMPRNRRSAWQSALMY